jgi:membrane protease YdiL (CAAX protease family)
MVFTGFGLSYIYERRGAILAPMAAHVAFNVIGLTLIYALG